MNIQTLRNDFPALQNYIWFQNGGVSMTPAPVAAEHARLMKELLDRGPMHIVYPNEEYPCRQETMARLARFFSVSPDELALMRGVSEAFQTVLRGLSWQAGDQLIITADEEAALLLPALHLRDRFGVEVVKVPLVDDYEGQVEAVTSLFTDRTRLVALSHVTTDLGFRLPVEPICAAARERGIPTFLDLAHSAGLYPMPLRNLNCDFAGILSYKWMYAPYASGVLYVHPDHLHDLEVTYAGGRSEAWLDFGHDAYEMRETAERFQYGPWSWPLIHAWAFAADYLTDIGLDKIWNRTVGLTTRLKEGLEDIPGAVLYTPASPDLSAALVTFGLEGWEGEALSQTLREKWNLMIKPLPHTREGLRASITFFTLEEEVDLLLETLGKLAH
jgi:cysteine desulfurase/selenocysteine lyase